MSRISTPQPAQWRDLPAGEAITVTQVWGPALAVLRMRIAASRDRLTRELAEGAHPGSSPQCALCAALLTSNRRRNQLLRTLRRIISEAHDPRLAGPRPVIIAGVRSSAPKLQST